MSDPHPPPFSGPSAPTPQRSGCATALLVVIGVLLILPGICVLIIASFDPKEVLSDTGSLPAVVMFFADRGRRHCADLVRRPAAAMIGLDGDDT